MQKLIAQINHVKNSEVGRLIEQRIKEFERVEDHFIELCFCLMTANFQAVKCLELQREIGQGFHTWSEKRLSGYLKKRGHRFWPQRAKHVIHARDHKKKLQEILLLDDSTARTWLVSEVDGIGLKEASHFLRNVGKKNVAIIDFHIIDLLKTHDLITFDRRNMSLTSKRYLEIEHALKRLGRKLSMDLATLDLYLWYLETGKVLK